MVTVLNALTEGKRKINTRKDRYLMENFIVERGGSLILLVLWLWLLAATALNTIKKGG